jgi:hypothetical protein
LRQCRSRAGLARRLDTPFVGRQRELQLIEQAFERAAGGPRKRARRLASGAAQGLHSHWSLGSPDLGAPFDYDDRASLDVRTSGPTV